MLEAVLRNKTNSTLIQLFRYTFVGSLAFIVDFSSLFILTDFFNIYYLMSAAIAFLLGLITNYALSIIWVFNKRTFSNQRFEFIIFAMIGVIGLGFNHLFMWFFTEHAYFHYLLSKVVSTAIVFWWNFFARKYTLFY